VSDQPKIIWADLAPDAFRWFKGEIGFEEMRDSVLAKARENEENSQRVRAYIESLKPALDPHFVTVVTVAQDLESYGRDGIKRKIGFGHAYRDE
jgi:hypothetical protein